MLALKCLILSVKICKSLRKLKRMKRIHFVFDWINYIDYHIEFSRTSWVVTNTNAFQYIFLNLILLHANWQVSIDRWAWSSSKQHLRNLFMFVTLILYENSMWEPHIVDSVEYNMCSLNSFEFSKRLANLYTKYKTLQCQHSQQTTMNQT